VRETLHEVLAHDRLMVLCGSGGVGKTTTSAALALTAALQGRKVLVLTIDPARRLLQALGLHDGTHPSNTPLEVLPRMAGALGHPPGLGTLHAMMLDAELGAVTMIERLLPDPKLRDRVLTNRIYRAFLPTLAASPDYIALELIHNLMEQGIYDLLVLDTPPMHNAVDFLHAGGTLSSFLNERVLKWFSKVPQPGQKSRFSFLQTGASMAMSVLGRLFGTETLPDIAEFFASFQEVLPRLRQRTEATDRMLRAPGTSFLVVTAPGETSLREAWHLHAELREQSMPFAGFVINRVLERPEALTRLEAADPRAEGLAAQLEQAGLPGSIAERLVHATAQLEHLVAADATQVQTLRALAGAQGFTTVAPQREDELHTLAELRSLGELLLSAARRDMLAS
jgi:anion-transporting  ArsA/GET3 family ATPase